MNDDTFMNRLIAWANQPGHSVRTRWDERLEPHVVNGKVIGSIAVPEYPLRVELIAPSREVTFLIRVDTVAEDQALVLRYLDDPIGVINEVFNVPDHPQRSVIEEVRLHYYG